MTFAVIDSIARSGTTLLSSLLHSQERVAAFRGVFHEPMACDLGSWPHGLARTSPIPPTKNVKVVSSQTGLPGGMMKLLLSLRGTVLLNWDELKANTRNTIHKEKQCYPISYEEWDSILATGVDSISKLDEVYESVLHKSDVDVLVFRWNQAWPYQHCWTSRPLHKWITIIRNPMDRACSSFQTHGWPWEESLATTIAYAKYLESVASNNNVHIMYYEDLVASPEKELSSLFNFLGHTPQKLNLEKLVGQDGKPYTPQSSKNIEKTGNHKEGAPSNDIYNNAVGRYASEMPQEIINKFRHSLAENPFYKRFF